MNDNGNLNGIELVCPRCKRLLNRTENAHHCIDCGRTYPILDGIPDFLAAQPMESIWPMFRSIRRMEFLAPIYEGKLWHSFILRMAGGRASTLEGIAAFVAEAMAGVSGSVVDVACGPAVYGRRVASADRRVYGVDFSMGTLRQGLKNIARDGGRNMRLVRAGVDELPFTGAVFDGALCCGALHLFPDTSRSLREIARIMKIGAPLVVTTFVEGDSKLTRRMKQRKDLGIHVFEPASLQRLLGEAGFEKFEPNLDGCFLTFKTRKTEERQ